MDHFPDNLISFQRLFLDEAACAAWLAFRSASSRPVNLTMPPALDIPPSKFEEAESRYKTIGDWLDRDESTLTAYEPAISPQGYLGVHCEDGLSISLLQAKLNELDTGLALRVAYDSDRT